MRRSEFERFFGEEAASVAEGAGAKFEPEQPELRLVALSDALPLVVHNMTHYGRPLSGSEAIWVAAWWNARAAIKAALVWPLGCATPAEGSPCGLLIETLKAALSESEIR